jgi:hypothetical protein
MQAGRIIADIGRRAKVVVNKAEGRFATAHDMRRSFCTRWAKRVMPAVLQRLARHSHITTTLTFYVAQSAAEIAADLWAEFGNISAGIIHEVAHASMEIGGFLRLNRRFWPCRRLHLLGEAELSWQNANRCEKTG